MGRAQFLKATMWPKAFRGWRKTPSQIPDVPVTLRAVYENKRTEGPSQSDCREQKRYEASVTLILSPDQPFKRKEADRTLRTRRSTATRAASGTTQRPTLAAFRSIGSVKVSKSFHVLCDKHGVREKRPEAVDKTKACDNILRESHTKRSERQEQKHANFSICRKACFIKPTGNITLSAVVTQKGTEVPIIHFWSIFYLKF